MIINFTFKNFKNFTNTTEFSFLMGRKKELEYHAIEIPDGRKVLPIKTIYGSNSVGKTNIIKALNILKKIILNHCVREKEDKEIAICSSFNSIKDYESPMEFNIEFAYKKNIYNYILNLKNNYENKTSKVLYEKLLINKKMIFERQENKLTFSDDKQVIQQHYKYFADKEYADNYLKMAENNLDDSSIFTKWYSNIDNDLCNIIIEYFYTNIGIILDVNKAGMSFPHDKSGKNTEFYESPQVNNLLKELKVGNQKKLFKVDEKDQISKQSFYSIGKTGIATNSESTESKGTLKLIDLLQPISFSLNNGTSLFIDELDSSIHHEIIISLIEAYADPEMNKKGAQLIFTTHNPVYMDKNILRRDEIVFVEHDNNSSSLCTLEDYNLRNDEVYLKNYLDGKYTIIPDVNIQKIIGE